MGKFISVSMSVHHPIINQASLHYARKHSCRAISIQAITCGKMQIRCTSGFSLQDVLFLPFGIRHRAEVR